MFAASPAQGSIIDGTGRKRQRSSGHDRQKAYYSGKKKAYTDKNKLIIDSAARTVLYLSPTVTGKTHDKALADQCKDVFKDTRQGYDDLVMEIACGLHNHKAGHRYT